tara:strand:- start:645 stop:899 length:255 start_codon:yes stop_codon:yes gene_type:complete
VLGISFDSPAANKKFRDKYEFPFDLLCDISKETSIAFGVADADSRSAARKSVLIAPDGTVAKSYNTVKPVEHPDQVLSDLKNLG